MAQKTRAQLKTDSDSTFLTGGRRTTAVNVRGFESDLLDSVMTKSDDAPGYVKFSGNSQNLDMGSNVVFSKYFQSLDSIPGGVQTGFGGINQDGTGASTFTLLNEDSSVYGRLLQTNSGTGYSGMPNNSLQLQSSGTELGIGNTGVGSIRIYCGTTNAISINNSGAVTINKSIVLGATSADLVGFYGKTPSAKNSQGSTLDSSMTLGTGGTITDDTVFGANGTTATWKLQQIIQTFFDKGLL